ncbi:MAG: fused signal recognition particle receptor [Candidatus Dependentiae bacterium]|nr:fused signal recognition particle receptor [Candidatus Dependentiae bacterium]
MFGFIKEKLNKAYQAVTKKLASLFTSKPIDQAWLEELKVILLAADTGPIITNKIITYLTKQMKAQSLSGQQVHDLLVAYLQSLLPPPGTEQQPIISLIVGINGSGKTTFIGKLAHKYAHDGKKVLVVAGDTFRAAATDQLAAWTTQSGTSIHIGKPNQDPSSVVFEGCAQFAENKFDHLIIDTAGRLQTKTHLMQELAKIKRTIHKRLPEATIHTWLVLDSMLGQNCIAQARQFHETTKLTGLVLTKCDGTGKAGFLLNISHELSLPIVYITFGEQVDALASFDSNRFIEELLKS